MSSKRVLLTILAAGAVMLALGSGAVQATPSASGIQASARWFTDYVDDDGDVGEYAAIAFDPDTGTPWISYYDATNTALKVAHYVGSGGNCGPANDWTCETVDNTGNVGMYSSIDVRPTGDPPLNTRRIGVAYYDATHGALKFAEYSCLPIPCQWRVVTVQDADYMGAPSYGQYASLKYTAAGEPQIAFYLESSMFDDELNYAYPVSSGGNCGVGSAAGKWHCETVDSGNHMGQYASLDLGLGPYLDTPYIAYYDGSNGDLRRAYYIGGFAGNCGLGDNWRCDTVDGTDGWDVGLFVSLHAPDDTTDTLQLAYYDWSHGVLKYAVNVGGSGNCGPGNSFQCDQIDIVGGGPNKAISLAVDDANVPIIAYQAPVGLLPPQLKVAQPAASLGNCGPGATWRCATVDPGSAEEGEAAYVSIALDPNDLAMIAYSAMTTLGAIDLKIAEQRLAVYLPLVLKNSP